VTSLGIRTDAITFANCTMQSEKFITVREQIDEQVFAFACAVLVSDSNTQLLVDLAAHKPKPSPACLHTHAVIL
jgi:hypothetical protein